MIVLVIVGGVLAYLAMAGLSQPILSNYAAALCRNCGKGEKYSLNYREYEPGDMHYCYPAAALWFLTLPYVLTNMKVNDRYKNGREAIKSYHENKRVIQNKQRLERMEIEAGIR